MDDFIVRQDAINAYCEMCGTGSFSKDELASCRKNCEDVQVIMSVPAADVRQIVRARWIMHSDRPDTLICTACDHAFDVWVWDHKWMHFCPNCGADMREGDNNG